MTRKECCCFVLPVWAGLLCSHSDWYTHTLICHMAKELPGLIKDLHCPSFTSFLWFNDWLLDSQEISVWGEEIRRGVSLLFLESSVCCQVLWPRDRQEVSSCFALNRLGVEGLFTVWLWEVGVAAAAFLPPDEITAVVAAAGNSSPCCPHVLGLWPTEHT